jgi:hypothetical protein
VEWYWQGKTTILGEKLVSVALYSPQSSHGTAWDRSWTFVRGWASCLTRKLVSLPSKFTVSVNYRTVKCTYITNASPYLTENTICFHQKDKRWMLHRERAEDSNAMCERGQLSVSHLAAASNCFIRRQPQHTTNKPLNSVICWRI